MKARSRSRRSWFDCAATCCGLVAVLLGSFDGVTSLRAASHCSCSLCSPASWHAVETANFRILSFGKQAVDAQTAEACETMRSRLFRQWLGTPGPSNWTPKCEILLQLSDQAYAHAIGGAGNTIASSLIDRSHGKISRRRIDVRATQSNWQSAALGHELTHLVIADHFGDRALPRWADEGVAILADPAEKRGRHLNDFKNAAASRTEFRLLELITLNDYPPHERWGAFYGQSASLVHFLVERAGEHRFLKFIDQALEAGYEPALRESYQLNLVQLEDHLRAQLHAPARAAGRVPNPASHADPATPVSWTGRAVPERATHRSP